KAYAEWISALRVIDTVGKRKQAIDILKNLLKEGVPPLLRSKIWKSLLEIPQRKKKFGSRYFRDLANKIQKIGNGSLYQCRAWGEEGNVPCHVEQKGGWIPMWVRQIRRDVPRTRHVDTPELKQKLELVLSAYRLHNPKVGYCQGMNIIVAILLNVFTKAEDAFWALVSIIESRPGYYTRSLAGLIVDQTVIDSLLRMESAKLYRLLNQSLMGFMTFTTQCFVMLFAGIGIPLPDILRLWDCIFTGDDQMMFELTLALLRRSTPLLVDADEDFRLVQLLKIGQYVKVQPVIVEAIAASTRHVGRIAALRAFHRVQYVKDQLELTEAKIDDLARDCQIPPGDVSELWKHYLSVEPWSVLLTAGETNVGRFADLVCNVLHIDHPCLVNGGITSGFIPRLFEVTCGRDGVVSFERCLRLLRILTGGTMRERAELAFAFFDRNVDGWISFQEMYHGLVSLELMHRDSENFDLDIPKSPHIQFWRPGSIMSPTTSLRSKNKRHPIHSLSIDSGSKKRMDPLPNFEVYSDPKSATESAHQAAKGFTVMAFDRARDTMLTPRKSRGSSEPKQGSFSGAKKTHSSEPRVRASEPKATEPNERASEPREKTSETNPKEKGRLGEKKSRSGGGGSAIVVEKILKSKPFGMSIESTESSIIATPRAQRAVMKHFTKSKAPESSLKIQRKGWLVKDVFGVAKNAGIQEGWELLLVNEEVAVGLELKSVTDLCRNASLPCRLVFAIMKTDDEPSQSTPAAESLPLPPAKQLLLSLRAFLSIALEHPLISGMFFHSRVPIGKDAKSGHSPQRPRIRAKTAFH
ncbi:hypothetical protein AAMO2058_000832700, partial [Amorphochlora amoebiformis]